MSPTTFKGVHALLLLAAALPACPAALPAAPAPVPKEKPKQDGKGIQGTWRVVRVEANGKHLHHEVSDGQLWVITKDRLTVRYADGNVESFAYALDPAHKPKAIDLRPAAPATRSSFRGVYELKGDRLNVCRSRGRRPTGLTEGGVERGQVLFVLERVRK
jgi:uncharacterized protein (TIGR03067 family)